MLDTIKNWTFCQFQSQSNAGTHYSFEVIPLELVQDNYERFQCGFGPDFLTYDEAMEAAMEWLREMENGPYVAR